VLVYDNATMYYHDGTTTTILIDTTPPESFELLSPSDGSWTNTSPFFVWQASNDAESGIAGYELWIDGSLYATTSGTGTPAAGTPTLTHGTHTWYVVVKNNTCLSTKSSSTFTVKIDTTPPTGTPTQPTDYGTYSSSASITFAWTQGNATDTETGIAGYWLQVGTYPGVNNKFDGDVGDILNKTITNCQHSYTYYARVKARNGAGLYGSYSASSDGITIDTVSPITTDNAPSGWQGSAVTVILTPTDALSGVAQTYYTTNGSTPTTSSATGTTITLTNDGTYTIKYFSVDNASNAETIKTAANIVRIDKTPPSAFGLLTPANNSFTDNRLPTFTFSPSGDLESGIESYALYIDGTLSQTVFGTTSARVAQPLTLTSHTWYVIAKNYAGLSTSSAFTYILHILPPITITPEAMITTRGGREVSYEILVNNTTICPATFSLTLSGLDSSWYSLSPSSLSLASGEIGRASLRVSVPITYNMTFDTETLAFQVQETGGKVGKGSARLVLEKYPIAHNLLPENGSKISSKNVVFSWETYIVASTEAYIKKEGESNYTKYMGQDGFLHSVTIPNLQRDKNYTYYVKSRCKIGEYTSPVMGFYIENGIVFSSVEYNFSIERDYNQMRQIEVKNIDDTAHNLLVELTNPYNDMAIGFTGEGSKDNIISLAAGESKNVILSSHAQDAVNRNYELAIKVSTPSEAEVLVDTAKVNLNVRQPNIDFSFEEIGFDSQTLVKRFRVTNQGDPLTDLTIVADEKLRQFVIFHPFIEHASLSSGGSIEFNAIPILSYLAENSGASAQGILSLVAAQSSKQLPVDFSPSPGKNLWAVTLNNVFVGAKTTIHQCTNRGNLKVRFQIPAGIDRNNITKAYLSMHFNPARTTSPHNSSFFVNGVQVGELINKVPSGSHIFEIPASALIIPSFGVAANTAELRFTMKQGNYSLLSNFEIHLSISKVTFYACASTYQEAEQIAKANPYFTLEPAWEISIKEPAVGQGLSVGTVYTIKATSPANLPYVRASFSNGDSNIVISRGGDGTYTGIWIPQGPGSGVNGECIITVIGGACSNVIATRTVNLIPAPILNVSLEANKNNLLPGATLKYTIKYRNDGNAQATNVVIENFLPEGTVYKSGANYNAENSKFTWNLGNLAAGANGEVIFEVTVNQGTPPPKLIITNRATISSSAPFSETEIKTNIVLIRAFDVKQNPVSAAEVKIERWGSIVSMGTTNNYGYLIANDKLDTLALSAGDRIKIEKMIHREPARKHIGIEPDMFELYLESGTITTDGSWNPYTVNISNINAQHNVILAHPIFKWNLVVGAVYSMSENDRAGLANDLRKASNYLYDVTDGQMMLNNVHIYDCSLYPWPDYNVDYLITDINRAYAYIRWVGSEELGISNGIDGEKFNRAYFGRNEDPRTYIHEFGHYALGFYDEYKNGVFNENWWRNRSNNHPENYGLMNIQWEEPSEMSSKNDYLENRSDYNGAVDTTLQLHLRELPCWDWTKQMFDNPRPEGFPYNVNAYTSTTPSNAVSLVLPPPGHYDTNLSKSTGIGDRKGPNDDVGEGMDVFQNGTFSGNAGVIAALWNPDLMPKIKRVPVFSQDETSPELIVDLKMKGERIFSISILSSKSLSGVPSVEVYDKLRKTTKEVVMSRIGSSNEYRGDVEIGDAIFGEIRIDVVDLSGQTTSYTSKFNISMLFADFPSTLYDYYGLRLLNLKDDSISFYQEGIALTSGIRPIPPSDPDLVLVSKVYGTRLSSGATILNSSGWLNIDYLEELMNGIDKNSLAIYMWDKNTMDWVPIGGEIYAEENSISTSTDRLGIYAVFGRKSQDETPPNRIEDLTATTGTESCKVNLCWTAPGDDGNVGTASHYILSYNIENITEANLGSSTSIILSARQAGATEKVMLTMPNANKLYYFAIKVCDEAGNISTLSEVASATSYMVDTDGDGMSDDWETGHNLNPNTNDSSLDPDEDGLTNLREYQVGTDPNNPDSDGDGLTDGQEVNLHQTNPNSQDSDNDGLSDYREVMVFNTNPNSADSDSGSEGDASEILRDRNPNNPADDLSTSAPEPPKGLSAIPGDKRIDLSWNLSQELNIKGYKIYYGLSTNSYTASVDVGNVVSYQLQNLNNSTRYYIALKAYNLAGNESGYSNEVNATPIDIVAPSAIGNLSATRLDSTSVLLSWTASGDNGSEGVASSYDIRYSTSTITEQGWNNAAQVENEPAPKTAGTADVATVTSLSPGHIYWFAIRVYDEAQNISSVSNLATSSTNRPPILSYIGNKQVDAGVLLQFTILATDPDGDVLTYIVVGLPSGASLGSVSGVFGWTPTISQVGNHLATFTVTDDEGDYAEDEIMITVGNVNAPPELNCIPNIVISETEMVNISATATDPNNDSLTFTYSGWMNSATYTTTYNDAGIYTAMVMVNDGTLTDFQKVRITVNNLNRNPFINSTPISVGTEGTPYTYLVGASDLDGDSLSYSLTTFPSGATINASTGFIVWTPDYDQQGNRQMVVRASDGKGGSETQSFGVNVTDVDITAPTITLNTPDNTWFNVFSPTIDVDFSDDKSLDSGWYKVGAGGDWRFIFSNNLTTSFTGNFQATLPDNGIYSIYFKAIDSSGNLSEPTDDIHILTLRVDTVVPITSDNAPSGWQHSTVTVTLIATDTTSGIAQTYYSLNQQGWVEGTITTISDEGTTTLSYYSSDKAGNIEASHTTTVRIDMTSPTTTDNAPSGWQTANVVITLIATDTLSGVTKIYYTTDGSTPTTNSATGTTINLVTDGTYTIRYFSIDNVGNTETIKTSANIVMIDKTLPVTTDNAPSGWQPSTVTVTLIATDTTSGIAQTYYSLNQQGWVEGTTTTISDEGTTTISYYSVDKAGNIEASHTTTVRIDMTPPTTIDNAPSGWQTANVVITLIATDTLSGVAKTYYTTDGSTPTTNSATGTTINLVTDGTYTIKYFSIDNVGNTETIRTSVNIVMLDKTL
ncbi:MAG: chitobiase/beta-hexosaminidase C-terminal domain-containing protein, partial [Gammaproteobacteria bacterium]|nr:chitobiase/beta-hexosaminidase C-terminal domain-containing protein [Gammaproteobacteria bacterium]